MTVAVLNNGCRRFDRVCCRFGMSPFLLSPFRLVAIMTGTHCFLCTVNVAALCNASQWLQDRLASQSAIHSITQQWSSTAELYLLEHKVKTNCLNMAQQNLLSTLMIGAGDAHEHPHSPNLPLSASRPTSYRFKLPIS